MRRTFIIFIFLIFVKFIDIQTANQLNRSMNFTSITAKFNPKYFSNITTWIDNGSINAEMTTVRVLRFALRDNIEIQIKIDNSKKYQTMFAYDFDLCKLFSNIFHQSLMRTWLRSLLKHGNLMENCPVAVGHYYVHNMSLASNAIPAYLRSGEYRLNILQYYGKRKTNSEELVALFILDWRIY